MIHRILVAVTVLVALPLGRAAAQDVEMLGRAYGTRLPDAYFRQRLENPQAFRFSRAWRTRTGAPLLADADGGPSGAPQGTPLGPRPTGISGTLTLPLLLGLYSDSPNEPPYTLEEVQNQFFDGQNPTGTISDYYAEQSAGLLNLVGVSYPWSRATLTGSAVAGGVGGLTGGSVGAFIVELIAALDDGTLDWGQFDNDGPDGLPNSGDDDGYVDVLSVMHATEGAECSSDYSKVWSHRHSLHFRASAGNQPYTTKSPSISGGPIRIDDYVIQPVRSCNAGVINEIGVFAHELGHGLGLPDLYDTNGSDGQHGAVGRWGLMGSGSWGCRGGNPARPCDMGAWSKSILGWIEVETLDPGQDLGTLALTPINDAARKAYRIDSGDGANQYFLLETRSRSGFNQEVFGTGLLIWHIDDDVIANRWASNNVNTDPNRMGVWLRAGDGLDEAAILGGDRGDAGDPFPGSTFNTAFHAGSNPASFSHQGKAAGLTLLDIALTGDDVSFRVLTRYQTLSVQAGGTDGGPAMITVDGGAPVATDLVIKSAPFQVHTIEAAAGTEIAPGVRDGFQSWEDGSSRIRTYVGQLTDSTLIALYGGEREVQMRVVLQTPAPGIDPGQLETFPTSVDGWFDQGQEVSILATERTGFAFREWIGDLAGSPNPATVTLDVPLSGAAVYDLTFGLGGASAAVTLEAALPTQVTLEADNANLPVRWTLESGDLPFGLVFQVDGAFFGAAMQAGTFPLTVGATDAIGLGATAQVTLTVNPPNVGARTLGAPFYRQGVSPTEAQLEYLDRNGNANGTYDLGDFRAFVLATPDLTPGMTLAVAPARIIVQVPLVFEPGEAR